MGRERKREGKERREEESERKKKRIMLLWIYVNNLFRCVYKAIDKKSGLFRAIKIVRKNCLLEEELESYLKIPV